MVLPLCLLANATIYVCVYEWMDGWVDVCTGVDVVVAVDWHIPSCHNVFVCWLRGKE